MSAELPVLDSLPRLLTALDRHGVAVLVAPPGTGKTTGVPPALATDGTDGRVLVAEPRRLAARAAAQRMAADHGEQVGDRFGYSVRHDRRCGPRTRVEVVTEGLLLRRIQSDPSLEGVGTVVLDEFHERSVDVDLCLALLLDVRAALRDDLRILVMSATMDPDPVAALLGGAAGPAPVVRADAPSHPVRTLYRPGSAHDRVEDRVAAVVREALVGDSGDLLVFLPGRGEIAGTARRLGAPGSDTEVLELHGSASAAVQQRVLSPEPGGRRRVILSTSVAETSVTVPGVRIVVDAGLRRSSQVDPRTGLPSLVTRSVSRAGADQRRGRAGREAPGVCYRLWAESEEPLRAERDPAEVTVADLTPLVLQTLDWGVASPADLPWIDPPPEPAVRRAHGLLADLGAIDRSGRLTPSGRRLARLGLGPRLGAIALAGGDDATVSLAGSAGAATATAADVAAVLEVGGPGDPEVAERVRALWAGRGGDELARAAGEWARRIGAPASPRRPARPVPDDAVDRLVGRLVLAGFADRVARRRDGRRAPGVYQLRHGGEVEVGRSGGHLAEHEWVVVCDLDARSGSGRPGRLHLGAGLHGDDVRELLDGALVEQRTAELDPSGASVTGTIRWSLDSMTVDTRPWRDPDPEAVRAAVLDAVQARGPEVLPRWDESAELRSRVAFARARGAPRPTGEWPDWSAGALADTAAEWLAPFLTGRSDPAAVDLRAALLASLDHEDVRALDSAAPTHWAAADGRRFRLDYGALDGDPSSVLLAARLQQLLGIDEHPVIGPQRTPVSVELLSPAGRPVQRTLDLPGFWRGSYAQVRSEMRARYRRHDWPEHPESAQPPPPGGGRRSRRR